MYSSNFLLGAVCVCTFFLSFFSERSFADGSLTRIKDIPQVNSSTQNSTTVIKTPVLIINSQELDNGSKTQPSNAQAKKMLYRTPGAVAVVDAKTYEDSYALNFEDTLAYTPGVYAQKRFGEEVRLSLRGSGLSRGFHLRGVNLTQNGIPFNLADGAADFQEADTLALQRLEVYKGANALQYGATTLGGAINMVTKTGRSYPENRIRIETGSDNTHRANIQAGREFENVDAFVSLTGTHSDGFRTHDDQKNIKLNANISVTLSDNAETRFYLGANDIEQELPGSLSKSDALHHPEKADPTSITTDWHRDMRSVRLSNKTTFDISDDDQVDVGAFVNSKKLFHPITPFVGVIDQDSLDYGAFVQGSGEYQLDDKRNRYRLGITTHLGDVDAKVFQNIGGKRGTLKANAMQKSRNLVVYGENNFYLNPKLALVTGAQLAWSERDLHDKFNAQESDSKIYRAVNPKLGVLYEPKENTQVYANISKSHEPPTFSELTQGGTVGFTPVDAQRTWTAEIGTRGEHGRINWDISLYRAWLNAEMLQFTTAPSIPATTFNAQDTIHQGLELALNADIANNVFVAGDHVQWINAYTFSDYHFSDDAQYGTNKIPGQPQHFYQTQLRYDHVAGWHAAINVEAASKANVDFKNTLNALGFGIVDLNAGYDINDKINIYIDGRNLLDKKYISTFSTIVNSAGNTAVFYPGEGRSVFAGAQIKF